MHRSKKKPKFRLSLSVLIPGLIVLVIALGYGGYRWHRNYNKPTSLKTSDGQKVDLSPPTPSDKQDNDAHKDKITKQNTQSNTPSTGVLKSSTVVITNPDTLSTGVRAYVTGIFEEGGTCTATATQGSQTFTKTSSGFENVSYTQCAPLNWDNPLGSGSWTITVSYKSTTTESKQTTTLEVK